MRLRGYKAEAVVQVAEKCLCGIAVILVCTIDSPVDVSSIPTSLKKTQDTRYSVRIIMYCLKNPRDKQAIQEESQ